MRALAASMLAVAALGAAAPAAAQTPPGAKPTTDVRADRRSTAESIAAQYAAEQLRTARVADERMLRLLNENDAQRRQLAAVMKDARATAVQRDRARAELQRLDAELKAANARLLQSAEASDELRAQVAEYERQITAAVESASPEVLAAYEQYARGDRDAGYAVIDRLSQSEAEAALRAGQVRAGTLLRRPAVLALDRRLRGEMTVAQCIAAWERAQAADPKYGWGWIKLADLYQAAGRLADKRRAVEAASAHAADDYERAVSVTMTADVLHQSGDLVGARARMAESLPLFRDLAARTPDDLAVQQALGIAYRKLGDIENASGAKPAALEAMQAGVAQLRRVAADWPADAATQNYLADAIQALGDVQSDLADYPAAAASFREALAITRRLSEAHPQDVEMLGDMSLNVGRLGITLGRMGQREEADGLLREYLDVARGLSARDPSNMAARQSVAYALDALGGLRLDNGDAAGALALFQESLPIKREVAQGDSSSAAKARSHASSLCNVADAKAGLGRRDAASESYERCLAAYEALSRADPTNVHLRRDIWLTWWKMAESLRRPGAWAQVVAGLEAQERLAPLLEGDAAVLRRARAEAAIEAGAPAPAEAGR